MLGFYSYDLNTSRFQLALWFVYQSIFSTTTVCLLELSRNHFEEFSSTMVRAALRAPHSPWPVFTL